MTSLTMSKNILSRNDKYIVRGKEDQPLYTISSEHILQKKQFIIENQEARRIATIETSPSSTIQEAVIYIGNEKRSTFYALPRKDRKKTKTVGIMQPYALSVKHYQANHTFHIMHETKTIARINRKWLRRENTYHVDILIPLDEDEALIYLFIAIIIDQLPIGLFKSLGSDIL